MRVGGGLFLIGLGAHTFLARPGSSVEARATSLGGAYLSTVALTLANPTTILSFAAVFAGLGLVDDPGTARAAVMVAGVYAGSALWWLGLSWGASRLRGRIDLRLVNRISGGVIAGFGIASIATLA